MRDLVQAKYLAVFIVGFFSSRADCAQAQNRPRVQEKTKSLASPVSNANANSGNTSLFTPTTKDTTFRDVTKHPLELRVGFTTMPNPGNLVSGNAEVAYSFSNYWSLDLGYSLAIAKYGGIRARSNGIDPFPSSINYDANGNPITNPFGSPGAEQNRARLNSDKWFLHFLSMGPSLRIDHPFTWDSDLFIFGSIHLGRGWARDKTNDLGFSLPLLLSLSEGIGMPFGPKQQTTVSVLATYVLAPAQRTSPVAGTLSDGRLPLHWWGVRVQASYSF